MSKEEELVRAFREGRLTRRAFVRQLVEGGMEMPAALAYAEVLVPAPNDGEASTATATGASPSTSPFMPERPVQVDELEINFVGDGYVVYHPSTDRMHSLNHTAAVVLELCTGANDQSEIARLLRDVYELPEPPEDDIRQCLESLFEEGLIR
jgi:hypothetical protein